MNTPTTNFVDDLAEAHVELRNHLQVLEEVIRSPEQRRESSLAAQLRTVQVRVVEHFRFEEQDGYMDAVRVREPRLERTIADLLEDHRILAETLTILITRAEGRPTDDTELHGSIRAWMEHLRRHEARENALVEDAYNSDIGDKD